MAELIAPEHFTELANLDPRDVCKRAACAYNEAGRYYTLNLWSSDCRIYPGKRRVERKGAPAGDHGFLDLLAVQYLLCAKEIEPSGRWISEKDLPGGATFFRGPHAIPTHLITSKVENSRDLFQQLCSARHGIPLEMADAAFCFRITERIPIAVLYWAGDDEFPAEAKLLYDQTLPNHLALDIVFALAVGICEELGR